jgi:hypothetical protein
LSDPPVSSKRKRRKFVTDSKGDRRREVRVEKKRQCVVGNEGEHGNYHPHTSAYSDANKINMVASKQVKSVCVLSKLPNYTALVMRMTVNVELVMRCMEAIVGAGVAQSVWSDY